MRGSLTFPALLFTLSLLASSSSTAAYSQSRHTPRPPPPVRAASLLTLGSSPYLCTPTSECLPCSPQEIEQGTPTCKIWGNKRSLSCTLYRSGSGGGRLDSSSPVRDPDAQYDLSEESATTTLKDDAPENEPSKFYELGGGRGAAPGTIGQDGGYESSDSLEDVEIDRSSLNQGGGGGGGSEGSRNREQAEAELREVMNAEKRSYSLSPRSVELGLVERAGGDGRIETWEACPKVVKREQSDYFEFVLCNLFFALSGLAVLLYRQRTLAGRQFGKLVARIMQTEIR